MGAQTNRNALPLPASCSVWLFVLAHDIVVLSLHSPHHHRPSMCTRYIDPPVFTWLPSSVMHPGLATSIRGICVSVLQQWHGYVSDGEAD